MTGIASVPPGSRLISVGNVVVDITARVDDLPQPGGDVIGRSTGPTAGGAAFNVLVAATRQGLLGAYAGAHGTGPFGELARAALHRERIGILLPPVPDEDTGFDVAITDAAGERTFITAVGAEASLTGERLAAVEVSAGDLVHVSGYGLLREPSRTAITGWLGRLPPECRVLVDPGPLGHEIPADTLAAVRQRADWWSCNLAEALAASGSSDAVEAARWLATTGRSSGSSMGVIVRLGADGCVILAAGDEPVHVPGFTVDTVDSNGAGDTHVGAFLAALAAGQHPLAATRRANACAALSIARTGPATAPARAEVDALLASGT
jgi:sugar/nucleoside kinase (ribokinase family)